jgi:tetratricopeptide (TPR) repeat protein
MSLSEICQSLLKWTGIGCLILAACLPISNATAEQRPEAQLDDEQRDLNDRAVEAMVADNHARAAALLEEAIDLGANNVLLFNLGRAYQHLGKCRKALATFEASHSAPTLAEPPPDRIAARADEHLAELREECPDEPAAASDDAVEDSIDDDAVGEEPIDDDTGAEEPIDDDTTESTSADPYTTWGWVAIGTGVALGATGLGLHLGARSQRASVIGDEAFDDGLNTEVTQAEAYDIEQRANRLDTAALGTATLGAAAVSVGTYLLLADHEGDADRVGLTIGADSVGLHWVQSF